MEICRNFVVAQPVISTTLKKNQPPILDTFGPFPDETILSSLDRLLFFLGVRRVQKYLNLPTPSCDCSSNSDCSITVSCPDERGRYRSVAKLSGGDAGSRRCVDAGTRRCVDADAGGENVNKSGRLSPCPVKCTPKKRSCCMTKVCPPCKKGSSVRISDAASLYGDNTSPKRTCLPIKRSFSLCSLACRKLKKMVSCQTTKEGAPIWLWTHMQSYADGTRVLQIFESSGVGGKPPSFRCSQPKIIFVVLSNGSIVPFESLKSH